MNEKAQGPNPNEFNAFRHLDKNFPAALVERNYLTFGLGKRACPGRSFAINGMKVTLHYLLLKYHIRNVDNENKPKVFGPYTFPYDEGIVFEKRIYKDN